ncbi:MAG: thioredoxin protein [Microbacteriaceae bacterium]|nr:thioredoxin protein [Microbacteriaceae bacterium]
MVRSLRTLFRYIDDAASPTWGRPQKGVPIVLPLIVPNRLADAISPYLTSHAENPVDWFPWGDEAFAEAERRDVPLLVSIGYSTCHWCHVMARESFSDPALAAYLNEHFVSIKVDREEHPDVDSSYLTAAGAFTENLGWPLNVFVTPQGRAFFAGTYWPPTGEQSFTAVLEAVVDAWATKRDEVERNGAAVVEALASARPPGGGSLPTDFGPVIAELLSYEDEQFGGFGGAPKFPVAPVLLFLLGTVDGRALASRTLSVMAASGLRDPVEGGFFRYATRRDWSDPHYERMLYDNAQLLEAYALIGDVETASGIASFLLAVMQQPGGGFASAQDSESTVDGDRVEGGYYALDAVGRARQEPPALDGKILTGWNGLAIDALALAGFAFDRPEWVEGARHAAEFLLANHLREDGTLIRASIDGRRSDAVATLEDYGMLAGGLLRLAVVSGEVRYVVAARGLVERAMAGIPGDPLLDARGLAIELDPSEGAYPSGVSALAAAQWRLYLLGGDIRFRDAAAEALASIAPLAVARPVSFGAALAGMAELAAPVTQLVVIGEVPAAARSFARGIVVAVSALQAKEWADAGFELLEDRDRDAVYLCTDFVCRLPVSADAFSI